MKPIAAWGLIFPDLLGLAWADDVPTIEGVEFVSTYVGDTCTFRLIGAARAMLGEIVRVRLTNADAPEIGARSECADEAESAVAARDWIAGVLCRARKIRLNRWPPPAAGTRPKSGPASVTWADSLCGKGWVAPPPEANPIGAARNDPGRFRRNERSPHHNLRRGRLG